MKNNSSIVSTNNASKCNVYLSPKTRYFVIPIMSRFELLWWVWATLQNSHLLLTERLTVHNNILWRQLINFAQFLSLHYLSNFQVIKQSLEHSRAFPQVPSLWLINRTSDACNTLPSFWHRPHCSEHTITTILCITNDADLLFSESVSFKASIASSFHR